MDSKILFKSGKPIPCKEISRLIDNFGDSYNRTVREIILSTDGPINKDLFIRNAAKILNNFKMTRQGPFRRLGFDARGKVTGPVEKLDQCWKLIGEQLLEIKSKISDWDLKPRSRTILLMKEHQINEIVDIIWSAFKRLLPATMSEHSYGLVGASKILFAVFPEIVLSVDNLEWKHVFKTVDLGDIIKLMVNEIREWQK